MQIIGIKYCLNQVHLLAEAEGNFVNACTMFVVDPFVFGPAFVIKLHASFLVRYYSP